MSKNSQVMDYEIYSRLFDVDLITHAAVITAPKTNRIQPNPLNLYLVKVIPSAITQWWILPTGFLAASCQI